MQILVQGLVRGHGEVLKLALHRNDVVALLVSLSNIRVSSFAVTELAATLRYIRLGNATGGKPVASVAGG